jgi:2-polyprenyl-3-methyl-5-hydroxy-6-metoxy-1,4-benzoquinol methylase
MEGKNAMRRGMQETGSSVRAFPMTPEGDDVMSDRACPLCQSHCNRQYVNVNRRYASNEYKLDLLKCAACGFVFLGNEIDIEYDGDYLARENVLTKDDPYAQFIANERVASIARVVPPEPGKAFLDIGIGDGLLLYLAEELGYTTYGLDINADGLRLARSIYGIRAAFSLEPMADAFPGTQFDVIHMNEVIEHVPNPMPLLKDCRKRLKEGGILVIQTGNIDSIVSKVTGRSWAYIRPVHVSYFSTKTLLHAVEESGFKPIKWMTLDWRLQSVVNQAGRLLKHGQVKGGLKMMTLYLTSIAHGMRRSVVVYAM